MLDLKMTNGQWESVLFFGLIRFDSDQNIGLASNWRSEGWVVWRLEFEIFCGLTLP